MLLSSFPPAHGLRMGHLPSIFPPHSNPAHHKLLNYLANAPCLFTGRLLIKKST